MTPCLDIPERLVRMRDVLFALGEHPPNALLLEGGLAGERDLMALFWAARLNCPSDVPPCLECTTCRQVTGLSHRDVLLLDGKQGTVGIDPVREVRSVMGQPPAGDGWRVIVVSQAQNLTQEAANALLKSLEEPLPRNVFVLLVPQRAWLLPTLVSRSWVFTLGWHTQVDQTEDISEWKERLLVFWDRGKGLFQHTAAKDQVDGALVRDIAAACQKALIGAITGQGTDDLSVFFRERLSPGQWTRMDTLIGQVQESVQQGVSPGLVLDWFALTIWRWVQGR